MKYLLLMAVLFPAAGHAAPEVFSVEQAGLRVSSPDDDIWMGCSEGALDSADGLVFTLMREGKAKLVQIHVHSAKEDESVQQWFARCDDEITRSGATIVTTEDAGFAGIAARQVRSIATTGSGESRAESYLFSSAGRRYRVSAVLFSSDAWPSEDPELRGILEQLELTEVQPNASAQRG
jgi:hypothetical protein